MTWPAKIKLNKQLLRSVTEAGYDEPTEIQLKTLSRIIGGQDVIAIGPEGCGKTTAYVLAVLNRFNHAPDGVPQVLVLVPDREAVEAVIDRFDRLNRNRSINIVGLYAMPGTEAQMDALADGADIVVATPDRARAIYLKLGLNLNKIELLILDDADLLVKQGLQLPITELSNSIVKAQRLVFTSVLHDKLEKMVMPFMIQPAVIEVEALSETTLNLYPQILYHVPNFGTKINLLNLFAQDDDLFTKIAVFVNTRQTAEKLYKSLYQPSNNPAALYNGWGPGYVSFSQTEDFISDERSRVLIIANENGNEAELSGLPFILHFDLPDDEQLVISRLINKNVNAEEETLSITFATDLELAAVKRIEQLSGQKFPLADLPADLVIEHERKRSGEASAVKTKDAENSANAAFHEKKAKNAKTYNFSSGEKAKMNKKKKHG